MAITRWNDLKPAQRATLVTVGVTDAALRAWSLWDLAHRPDNALRGKRALWAPALAIVNSAGLLPLIYLTRARKS